MTHSLASGRAPCQSNPPDKPACLVSRLVNAVGCRESCIRSPFSPSTSLLTQEILNGPPDSFLPFLLSDASAQVCLCSCCVCRRPFRLRCTNDAALDHRPPHYARGRARPPAFRDRDAAWESGGARQGGRAFDQGVRRATARRGR